MSTQRIVDQCKAFFLTVPNAGLCCAYLFGSVARGEVGVDSDVDIAVLYCSTPPSTLAGSGGYLAAELEAWVARPVDLIVLNRSDPDLTHRVLRDGILLFDHDPGKRVAFEIKLRNQYFDIKPYLDDYRRVKTG